MSDNVRKYHRARQLVAAEIAHEIRKYTQEYATTGVTKGVYTLSLRQSMPFNFPEHGTSLRHSLERRLSRELGSRVTAEFTFRKILPPRIKINLAPR